MMRCSLLHCRQYTYSPESRFGRNKQRVVNEGAQHIGKGIIKGSNVVTGLTDFVQLKVSTFYSN